MNVIILVATKLTLPETILRFIFESTLESSHSSVRSVNSSSSLSRTRWSTTETSTQITLLTLRRSLTAEYSTSKKTFKKLSISKSKIDQKPSTSSGRTRNSTRVSNRWDPTRIMKKTTAQITQTPAGRLGSYCLIKLFKNIIFDHIRQIESISVSILNILNIINKLGYTIKLLIHLLSQF